MHVGFRELESDVWHGCALQQYKPNHCWPFLQKIHTRSLGGGGQDRQKTSGKMVKCTWRRKKERKERPNTESFCIAMTHNPAKFRFQKNQGAKVQRRIFRRSLERARTCQYSRSSSSRVIYYDTINIYLTQPPFGQEPQVVDSL